MFRYYIVPTGCYSHHYADLFSCYDIAKRMSHQEKTEIYVIDDTTAEVLAIYNNGLLIE